MSFLSQLFRTSSRLVGKSFGRLTGCNRCGRLMMSSAQSRTNASGTFRVFCTRKLPDEFLQPLLDNPAIQLRSWSSDKDPIPRETLLREVVPADGLVCLLTDRIDKEVLDAGAHLKAISTMSVGYEHVDIAECVRREVRVGHTPDVLTNATAELAVALLLATARRLPQAAASVKEGLWGPWNPTFLLGVGVCGSTVGVVGMGRIGRAFARIMKAFKVNLLYCGNSRKPDVDKELGAEFVGFEDLLARSDFVVACCALTPATRDMFNSKAFSLMKSSAVFVNVARGAVVDQEALEACLQRSGIRAAGLDVTSPEPLSPDHSLLSLPNCLVLPHIGSAEERTRQAMGQLASRNMVAALEGKQMPAEVMASH